MENNFQFARWKNTFAAAVAASWPCPEKQSLPSTSEKLFEYFSFLFFLCSASFCLPLSARGVGGEDGGRRAETEIYNGNCRRLVCAARGLLLPTTSLRLPPYLRSPPPTPHNWPTARLLAGVVGVALLFLSRRQPSKHLQQCRKRIQQRHTQQTQYSTEREHDKTRVLWRGCGL